MIVDAKLREPAARRALLFQREIPASLSNLRLSAHHFVPSSELCAAINVALALGAPLLLTGEPGSGKTQVAHYLAWYFGVEEALFQLDVRSNTTAEDLLYQFDSVAYFHAAHDPARGGSALERRRYLKKGPLWLALEAPGPSVVLIDEIDKAPRDFPNDLLGVLGENRFFVRELDDNGGWIERRAGNQAPILVITSNSERRLPEPFLRRCIFHHIELTDELLRRAVQARRLDFSSMDDTLIATAIDRFMELRGKNLRKKPSTAEFLAWLVVLAAQGVSSSRDLSDVKLSALPALSVLIKDRDDHKVL